MKDTNKRMVGQLTLDELLGRRGPMRYAITVHGADLEIRAQQAGAQTPQLLASLQDCQHGRCGCPTDQYERLEDMAGRAISDELTIRLHPRDGQRLDTGELLACLDYTIAEATRDTPAAVAGRA